MRGRGDNEGQSGRGGSSRLASSSSDAAAAGGGRGGGQGGNGSSANGGGNKGEEEAHTACVVALLNEVVVVVGFFSLAAPFNQVCGYRYTLCLFCVCVEMWLVQQVEVVTVVWRPSTGCVVSALRPETPSRAHPCI